MQVLRVAVAAGAVSLASAGSAHTVVEVRRHWIYRARRAAYSASHAA